MSAQAGQVGEMANVLTRVQESAAQERGTAEVIDAPHNSVPLLFPPYRNGCGGEFLRVKFAQELVEVRFQNENVTGFFLSPAFFLPQRRERYMSTRVLQYSTTHRRVATPGRVAVDGNKAGRPQH